MAARSRFTHPWLMRAMLVSWIASSLFVAYLLLRLDSIVHTDLYNYGLQYSFAWALPFWSFERLIYVVLAIPSVLSGIILIGGLLRRDKAATLTVRTREVKPSTPAKQSNGKENGMLINCPKCHKVFGKPLTMLDFTGGKTKLVNVCPYCNHVLGKAEEADEDIIRVVDTGKRVIQ